MTLESRIRGCLLGGAVGDALGAGIEFDSLSSIRRVHGPVGVTGYVDAFGAKGRFTDDTQMTLFTAEGLLLAGDGDPVDSVHRAYLRWLATQGMGDADRSVGWLAGESLLNHRRAPGNTCTSSLMTDAPRSRDIAINNSKGCGGVMRIAPVGFLSDDPYELGCDLAAITHSHRSGYTAAGAMALLIRLLYGGGSLKDALPTVLDRVSADPDATETETALRAAMVLATEGNPTPERLERLGAGWIAEEALAISVYAALAEDSFVAAVLLAVNHSGDSDSTGCITGHILGTILGVEAVPTRWLDDLEGRDIVERLALEVVDAAYPAGRDSDEDGRRETVA